MENNRKKRYTIHSVILLYVQWYNKSCTMFLLAQMKAIPQIQMKLFDRDEKITANGKPNLCKVKRTIIMQGRTHPATDALT